MKNFAITTMTAGALVAAALGMAGAAAAAPSGPSSVADTVTGLQADGSKVIVTRLSGGESSKCSVSAIRPGQQIIQQVPIGGGDTAQQVVSKTVYVDVRC
jgi:hypothetical protein